MSPAGGRRPTCLRATGGLPHRGQLLPGCNVDEPDGLTITSLGGPAENTMGKVGNVRAPDKETAREIATKQYQNTTARRVSLLIRRA